VLVVWKVVAGVAEVRSAPRTLEPRKAVAHFSSRERRGRVREAAATQPPTNDTNKQQATSHRQQAPCFFRLRQHRQHCTLHPHRAHSLSRLLGPAVWRRLCRAVLLRHDAVAACRTVRRSSRVVVGTRELCQLAAVDRSHPSIGARCSAYQSDTPLAVADRSHRGAVLASMRCALLHLDSCQCTYPCPSLH
jgi:hypothetical protein